MIMVWEIFNDPNHTFQIVMSGVELMAQDEAIKCIEAFREKNGQEKTTSASLSADVPGDLQALLLLKSKVDPLLNGDHVATIRYAGEGHENNGLDVPVKELKQSAESLHELLQVNTSQIQISNERTTTISLTR